MKKYICRLPALLLAVALLAMALPQGALADTAAGYSSVGGAPLPEQPPDTAANWEQLRAWLVLHSRTGGELVLTNNIVMDGEWEYTAWPHSNIVIVTGDYTITITGNVTLDNPRFALDSSLLTLRGNEPLRVATGGRLTLVGVNLALPLIQEEGAGLLIDENCTLLPDSITYATAPVVWDSVPTWQLVEPGQVASEVMPATVLAQLNHNGKRTLRVPVAVTWELQPHDAAQAERLRFMASGSYPDYPSSLVLPQCTVAYHDYPLTFTKVDITENNRLYDIKCSFTMPVVPIWVAIEYSFDCENWTVFSEYRMGAQAEGVGLVLMKQGDSYAWDATVHPYLYIRMNRVDADPADGAQSNILRIDAKNLTRVEDIGGGRGGGTEILPPPMVPPPLVSPSPQPQPEPTPAPTPQPPVVAAVPKAVREAAPEAVHEAAPEVVLEAAPEVVPETAPEAIPPTIPVHPLPAHEQGEPATPTAGVLPIVVGCTAIGGTIAAAGACLYPSVAKQLLLRLLRLFVH